jgi:hypothetical protein
MTNRASWMLPDRWYNTDREKADLVNQLRVIAVMYHDAEQLRERLRDVIQPLFDEITKLDQEAEDRIDPD